MNYPLTFAAVLLVIACFVLGLFVAGSFGNGRALKIRERMRKSTPYVPPTNARPNDFDSLGRPY